MRFAQATVKEILTRATGFLAQVTSHSVNPYRGCAYGKSTCGVACYVQFNPYLTRGEAWGSFLEARTNAASAYRASYAREAAWARKRYGSFGVFMSSSTDPFQPIEKKLGITRALIEVMTELPPDVLILQTHSHLVAQYAALYPALAAHTDLRIQISVESDRDRLPGLPPPASSVARRLEAAASLKSMGLRTIVAMSPLHPIADPEAFFRRVAECADAVIIDHFIEGDGSPNGARTRKTRLPVVMEQVAPGSTDLAYRDEVAKIAARYLPVGVSAEGFAGVFRR